MYSTSNKNMQYCLSKYYFPSVQYSMPYRKFIAHRAYNVYKEFEQCSPRRRMFRTYKKYKDLYNILYKEYNVLNKKYNVLHKDYNTLYMKYNVVYMSSIFCTMSSMF